MCMCRFNRNQHEKSSNGIVLVLGFQSDLNGMTWTGRDKDHDISRSFGSLVT